MCAESELHSTAVLKCHLDVPVDGDCRTQVLLFPELLLLVNGRGRLAAEGWKYVHGIQHFQPLYKGLEMESGICYGVIAKILKSHMYPNCCL